MKNDGVWMFPVITALLISMAWNISTCSDKENENVVVRDSVVFDTIATYFPVPYDSVVVKYKTVTIPSYTEDGGVSVEFVPENNADSVEITLPITQKEYKDSLYYLKISGFEPALDEIKVFPKTVYKTKTIKEKDRMGFGVNAGYGIGEGGLSPYIGVGVSFNIFSW